MPFEHTRAHTLTHTHRHITKDRRYKFEFFSKKKTEKIELVFEFNEFMTGYINKCVWKRENIYVSLVSHLIKDVFRIATATLYL